MGKTGTKLNKERRLIRALRKVGRHTFIRGYVRGKQSQGPEFFSVEELRAEFDRAVEFEVRHGR